jgi:hypothetical protein
MMQKQGRKANEIMQQSAVFHSSAKMISRKKR